MQTTILFPNEKFSATSCQAIGCPERIPGPIVLKLSQTTLCYVFELL
jgi:hypothetical protein